MIRQELFIQTKHMYRYFENQGVGVWVDELGSERERVQSLIIQTFPNRTTKHHYGRHTFIQEFKVQMYIYYGPHHLENPMMLTRNYTRTTGTEHRVR